MNVTKDFEELFGCFRHHGVKALIVGAHAVAFYAKPRYTKDVDVLVEPSVDNAGNIIAALDDFGFGGLGLTIDDFVVHGQIIQLGVEPNRIDVITGLDAVSFDGAWERRVAGRYGTQDVWYMSKSDLIRAKEAAGRPQDLIDLSWLRSDG